MLHTAGTQGTDLDADSYFMYMGAFMNFVNDRFICENFVEINHRDWQDTNID